jgi:hypothetical protein
MWKSLPKKWMNKLRDDMSWGIEAIVSKHFYYFVVNQQTHNVKQAKVD